MADPATYLGVAAIGFVVVTTAVMLWFAFLGDEAPPPGEVETDGETDFE